MGLSSSIHCIFEHVFQVNGQIQCGSPFHQKKLSGIISEFCKKNDAPRDWNKFFLNEAVISRLQDLGLFPAWFISSVIAQRTLRSCRNMQAQTQGPASSPTLWKGTVRHGAEPYAPVGHLDRARGEWPPGISTLEFLALVPNWTNKYK